MLGSAGKRLIIGSLRTRKSLLRLSSSQLVSTAHTNRFSTGTTSEAHFTNKNPNNFPHNRTAAESEPSSSFTEPSFEAAEGDPRFDEQRSGGSRRRRVEYKEEQARLLHASLHHVSRLGWTEAAMMAGARDIGVSPSIVGSFPRKEAALVEYFMDDCLERLMDKIDSEDQELKNLTPSDRIVKLVKTRLEMQIPYISRWAQALSIQAFPANLQASFKQRAMLIDEIWHAAGDESSDIDWYLKRTVLGGLYSTTEVYMLTDNSQDFIDTWAFLDARVRDGFSLKKTIKEAQYFADTVGAGMGRTLQGLAKKVFQR